MRFIKYPLFFLKKRHCNKLKCPKAKRPDFNLPSRYIRLFFLDIRQLFSEIYESLLRYTLLVFSLDMHSLTHSQTPIYLRPLTDSTTQIHTKFLECSTAVYVFKLRVYVFKRGGNFLNGFD